jgi:hypothetical protein
MVWLHFQWGGAGQYGEWWAAASSSGFAFGRGLFVFVAEAVRKHECSQSGERDSKGAAYPLRPWLCFVRQAGVRCGVRAINMSVAGLSESGHILEGRRGRSGGVRMHHACVRDVITSHLGVLTASLFSLYKPPISNCKQTYRHSRRRGPWLLLANNNHGGFRGRVGSE